jgi:hypothetical protein
MSKKDEGIVAPPADEAEDAAAFMRWTPEFWEEDDSGGTDLIRAGLLIEGQINTLEGHYENGKTAVMVDVARQWIELGRPVLYLDYEMGKRRVKRRLRANKWTKDHLALWHYLYMPNPEPGLLRKLLAVLPEKPLVAVDSYSQAMMYLAREENSATEAGNWWVTELQGVREEGATVLVIDQVKQSATSRDRYAGRGTGAKSFGTDVKWFVERFEKFSPSQIGLVRLTLHKDREGVLPEQLAFRVGDGKGNLILSPTEPPKGDPVDAGLIEEVIDALRLGGWQTAEALKVKVGHGHSAISSALRYLETTGKVESRPRTGKGGGIEFALPDEKADDTPALD